MRPAPHLAEQQSLSGLTLRHGAPQLAQQFHPAASAGDVFEGAVLFRQLRHVVQLPIEHVAYRLGTTIETLEALENGLTAHLPQWPETVRIVTAYTAFANIDPRPVLSSIHTAMTARYEAALSHAVNHTAAGQMPRRRVPKAVAGVRGEPNDPGSWLGRGRQAIKTLAWKIWPDGAIDSLKQRRVIAGLSVTLPLALLMSLASGGPVQAVASVMPRQVTVFFRSVENYMRVSMAPRRDGHVWIEVSDPRSRKTDKLPSPRR
jgi:hypothetical protein